MKRAVATAAATIAACVILLTGTTCIPRSLIQTQAHASAQYFNDAEPFPTLIGELINSIQDNYSDTVLCDVVYCMDSDHPFSSAITAKYAQEDQGAVSDGFLAATEGKEVAYQEYGRYWHGTSVLIRPLLMIAPIQVIRILFGLAATIIQCMLMTLMFRQGRKAFAVCYLLALLLVHPWMFFASLEYGTAFLIASVAELVLYLRLRHATEDVLLSFFVATGIITCFMDFLTTETLTFTLPMLLLLLERDKQVGEGGSTFFFREDCAGVIKNGLGWLLGYVSMFAVKMLLLYLVTDAATVNSSFAEGMLRVGGQVHQANINIAPAVGVGGRLSGAIWHNLACLYPFPLGQLQASGALLPTVIILFIVLAAVYLLQDGIRWSMFVPMGLLAILPYARFLVLSNHSFIHFFITYRAQMVTLVVFLYFAYENALQPLFRKQ